MRSVADDMGGRIGGGRLLCLSAFSGIGGLDLGLERAGFGIVGAVESDAAARRSLALNRPRLPFLEPHDIEGVARALVPGALSIGKRDLALLAAGPPCQPFSKAAQWAETGALGLSDNDSTACLNGLLALIERLLPHAVLIENVPGFAAGRGSALPFLQERLATVNRGAGTRYRLSQRVLDAADFGVPQRRRRAIIVVLRNGEAFDWPAATHHGRPVRAWDALRGVRPEEAPAPSGQFAGLLPSVPEGMNYQHFTERGEGPALFGYRRRFWSFLLKLAKAEPAWTVPANPGPATGPFHWESRPLAPEEILRLQSFPGSWRLEGAYRVQVRQAGNATPPLLAELLGRSIARQLFGVDHHGPLSLAIDRSARVPPPTRPKPIPANYLSRQGEHPPHPGPGRGPRPRLARSAGPPGEEGGYGSALGTAKGAGAR